MLEAAQHFEFVAVEEKLKDGKELHRTLLKLVDDFIQDGSPSALKVCVLPKRRVFNCLAKSRFASCSMKKGP